MRFVYATLLVLIVFCAAAPCSWTAPWTLGVKGGGGFGWISGSSWEDTMERLDAENWLYFSYKVGIFADIELYRKGIVGIGIQPEFHYMESGGGLTDGHIQQGIMLYKYYNIKYYTKAIEIPLYPKFTFRVGIGSFYFLTGLDLLFYIDSGSKVTFWNSTTSQLYKYSFDSEAQANIGIGLGFGYDFQFKYIVLEIGVLYTPYLLSFSSHSETANDSRQNSFTVDIGVGYHFE